MGVVVLLVSLIGNGGSAAGPAGSSSPRSVILKPASGAATLTPGGTSKWVVACSAGRSGLGARKYVQSIYVTLSANGSTYTSSLTSPRG